METLGERIRMLRESVNLSQMELSLRVDISQSAIARYELNKTEPKASDIVKLADILGHSSVETTRIYLLTTGTEHRQQLERLRLVL